MLHHVAHICMILYSVPSTPQTTISFNMLLVTPMSFSLRFRLHSPSIQYSFKAHTIVGVTFVDSQKSARCVLHSEPIVWPSFLYASKRCMFFRRPLGIVRTAENVWFSNNSTTHRNGKTDGVSFGSISSQRSQSRGSELPEFPIDIRLCWRYDWATQGSLNRLLPTLGRSKSSGDVIWSNDSVS